MTKGEQARLTAWRWKILQHAADELNVARVCRHFGISRKSFYKWKRRHADHGAAGLCDRPRTPHRSPRATPRDVIERFSIYASSIISGRDESPRTCIAFIRSWSHDPRSIAF